MFDVSVNSFIYMYTLYTLVYYTFLCEISTFVKDSIITFVYALWAHIVKCN